MKPRFQEQEKVIFMKVMKVIQVMASFGKDFITQRFTEELWPALRKQVTYTNLLVETIPSLNK